MTKITQQELARRLGVSRSTVAAALNPKSPTKLPEATRNRVIREARKWNYRPDRYARVMRGGKSGLIGMLHFGGLLQVAAERTLHATDAVRRAGFDILSTDLSWSTGMVETACLSLLDVRVEGVIVSGLNDPAATASLERLTAARVPVVALSGNPFPGAAHFRGDASQAYLELTRHLIAMGHRRMALMIPSAGGAAAPGVYSWASGERLRGFTQGLKEAGGRVVASFGRSGGGGPQGIVSHPVFLKQSFDPFEPGRQAMRQVLALPFPPTAVLCSNDELAYGAVIACREQQVEVPARMAVTGYDDIALGRLCEVPLTTVRQPNLAMAEAAVQSLMESVRSGRPGRTGPSRVFPCEIVIRASSGVARPA